MNRTLYFILLLAVLPVAHGETFKIAAIVPDGTSWMKELRASAAEISRRTNNRVKFLFYPGGVMGNDASVLRKIRIGQLHGGALTGGGLSSIYPDSQIYSLVFAFRSYEEVDYVRERMDPLILAGLKNNGFISFGINEGGFAYLMSNKQVRCIDDLKKQKVWAPEGDRISRTAFEAIGISPIPLPLTDVLTGLQTGLVNTFGTSPIGAIALQWHTRVKYLTDMPLLYLYGSVVIQRRAFEKLSLEDQAIISEVLGEATRRLSQQNRKDNQLAREALSEQGIEFVQPRQDQLTRWNGRVSRAMDTLVEQGEVSAEIVRTLREHLHAVRQEYASPR
jgi:TRAP-type C4-dicarboxylate transport system substrate-binding protein